MFYERKGRMIGGMTGAIKRGGVKLVLFNTGGATVAASPSCLCALMNVVDSGNYNAFFVYLWIKVELIPFPLVIGLGAAMMVKASVSILNET